MFDITDPEVRIGDGWVITYSCDNICVLTGTIKRRKETCSLSELVEMMVNTAII